MGELILARHGDSVYSARGVVNGDPLCAGGLSSDGRMQATAFGQALAQTPLDLCVTSAFPRAVETADLALAGRLIPRIVMADLDDMRFGAFEGHPLKEYRQWAYEHAMTDRLPGEGESRLALILRYCRAFRALLARPERSILVIGHGLPITYIVNAAHGKLPSVRVKPVGYAAPNRLASIEIERGLGSLEGWAHEVVTSKPR